MLRSNQRLSKRGVDFKTAIKRGGKQALGRTKAGWINICMNEKRMVAEQTAQYKAQKEKYKTAQTQTKAKEIYRSWVNRLILNRCLDLSVS